MKHGGKLVHENINIPSENISPNYVTLGLFLLNLTKTSKADRQTDGRHLQRTGKPERMGTWGHWIPTAIFGI